MPFDTDAFALDQQLIGGRLAGCYPPPLATFIKPGLGLAVLDVAVVAHQHH